MDQKQPSHTVDAFHRGNFWLMQPKGAGHRAGADALVLAASMPSDFSGSLADFGAGAGAAGLAVISRCAEATVTLVEQSPEMAHFATLTLDLEQNRHLRGRASLLVADVALTGARREAAGLAAGGFDAVIMNPPFNPAKDRMTPDGLKRQAHVMQDGLFDAWIRSAAAVVRARGMLSIIARPISVGPILEAVEGRFGGAEILPVHARGDLPAIRIVVRARRGSRAPLVFCPPLVLHDAAGDGFSSRAEAINDGKASLFGD